MDNFDFGRFFVCIFWNFFGLALGIPKQFKLMSFKKPLGATGQQIYLAHARNMGTCLKSIELPPRNSATDAAAKEEGDVGDIDDEEFEVLELPANYEVLAENEPQPPSGSELPEAESEVKPPAATSQRQDQSVRPRDQPMQPGVVGGNGGSNTRYEQFSLTTFGYSNILRLVDLKLSKSPPDMTCFWTG